MNSPMQDALMKKKLGTISLDIHQDDNGKLTAELSDNDEDANGMELADESMEDQGSQDIVNEVTTKPQVKNPMAASVDDDKVSDYEAKSLKGKVKLAMQKAKAMK